MTAPLECSIPSQPRINDSTIGLLVAQQVQTTSVRTGVLLASKVEGNVDTYLDTPRALLAGVTAGVAMGLVVFALNLITGKKR